MPKVRPGDVASGRIGEVAPAASPSEALSVMPQRVTLQAGAVNVPLRSSQARGTAGPVQYRELPESGKMCSFQRPTKDILVRQYPRAAKGENTTFHVSFVDESATSKRDAGAVEP